MKLIHLILLAALAFTTQCSSPQTKSEPAVKISLPTTLEEAIKSEYRTPKNKERDQYRHPLETLTFFWN